MEEGRIWVVRRLVLLLPLLLALGACKARPGPDPTAWPPQTMDEGRFWRAQLGVAALSVGADQYFFEDRAISRHVIAPVAAALGTALLIEAVFGDEDVTGQKHLQRSKIMFRAAMGYDYEPDALPPPLEEWKIYRNSDH